MEDARVGTQRFARSEVEAAWAEFQRHGVQGEDWPAWSRMFTDDARYHEHNLGVFAGQAAIESFIVGTMRDYPSMTLWIEWAAIDGEVIAFYIWNNLPDPAGGGRRFGFPNTTFLRYGGDGKFDYEADFYNPADAERVFGEWLQAGGRRKTPQDRSLRGIDDWAPEVPEPAFPRDEVAAEFQAYRRRGEIAVRTGDWDQWADQFTVDARYREHHYGTFNGRDAIRSWITSVMQPFPTMTFPVTWSTIDGNRVNALIPNILPAPPGDDGYYGFDVHTILHYAGNGTWSYEEDLYSPREAGDVVTRWLAAGGTMG
jgi:predicted SnoaL-like aldol condensation-catalyzing enzyme